MQDKELDTALIPGIGILTSQNFFLFSQTYFHTNEIQLLTL